MDEIASFAIELSSRVRNEYPLNTILLFILRHVRMGNQYNTYTVAQLADDAARYIEWFNSHQNIIPADADPLILFSFTSDTEIETEREVCMRKFARQFADNRDLLIPIIAYIGLNRTLDLVSEIDPNASQHFFINHGDFKQLPRSPIYFQPGVLSDEYPIRDMHDCQSYFEDMLRSVNVTHIVESIAKITFAYFNVFYINSARRRNDRKTLEGFKSFMRKLRIVDSNKIPLDNVYDRSSYDWQPNERKFILNRILILNS